MIGITGYVAIICLIFGHGIARLLAAFLARSINNCILDNVKDPQVRSRIAHDMAIALGIAGIRSTRGGVKAEPAVVEVAKEVPSTKPRRLSVDEMLG